MKQFVYGIIVITVLCLQFTYSKAQSISIFYKQYTTNNGLHSSNITSITQDTTGYIWVASTNGISKFDGSKFIEYSAEKNNLPNNNVLKISTTIGGNVWASCYPYGIAKHNVSTDQFEDYSYGKNNKLNHFFSLRYTDRKSRNWIATMDENNQHEQGLYLCDENSIPIKKYTFSTKKEEYSRFNYNKISSCYERENGDLWLSTWKGIVLFNPNNGKHSTYDIPALKNNIACIKLSVIEDNNQKLWVGSWGSGLLMYDIKKNEWEQFKIVFEKTPTGVKNIIYSIVSKNENELWIASNHGLFIFNKMEKKFYEITGVDGEKHITSSVIISLYKDDQGNLWVGSATKGLLYIPSDQFKITYIPILNLKGLEGKAGGSKIIYDKELDCYIRLSVFCGVIYIYDRKTLAEKRIDADVKSMISFINFFDGIRLDRGKYLLLENNDFYILDILNNTLKPARSIHSQIPWRAGQTLTLTRFIHNEVVMLHPKGLLFYDPVKKTEKEFVFRNKNLNIYPHCYSYYIKDNKLWLLTDEKKCICFEIKKGELIFLYQFDMKSIQGYNDIISISETDLYAIDFTHLYHIKLSPNTQNTTIEKKSIPIGIAYQNLDQMHYINHELWISNIQSIIKYNPNTNKFASLNQEQYIHANAFNISEIEELNQIALSYDQGFLIVDNQENPWKKKSNIPLVINQFMIHNKFYKIKNINTTEQIKLNYTQNFISLDFSALTFNQSKQSVYEYKLEGIDATWNQNNQEHRATYTSLPPGKYILKLKARDDGFGWESIQKKIMIIITPPFWQTWWFYVLAILLSIICIYFIFRWRLNIIRKEARLKSEFEKKISETEMFALRAQMNPHFIFNCLNSINGYIVKNDPISASEYLTKFSKLIRMILDNSKKTKISLQQEIDAIKIYIEMESLRFSNKFDYILTIDENISLDNIFLPPLILQPFVENAIWHGLMHSKKPGILKIDIFEFEQYIEYTIEDNGVGRAKALERKVAEPLKKQSYGMEITEERIKQISPHSEIIITDLINSENEGIGTKITIRIPI